MQDIATINAREFLATSAALNGHLPLKIKGLTDMWPVVQLAGRSVEALSQHLKQLDTHKKTAVLQANPAVKGMYGYHQDTQEFNFSVTQMSITECLDRIKSLHDQPNPFSIYLQSAPVDHHLPGFAEMNPMPCLPPRVRPRIWLGNATQASLHNDNDANIACVVAGNRTFILFPPSQFPNLYIGPHDHTPAGRPISLADIENPDFDKYPKLKRAFPFGLRAELEPGDAIYIPKYWWHQVRARSPFNLLINYWWGSPQTPFENPDVSFRQSLLSLKDLPAPEKTYWKQMFDSYIFADDPEILSHLPAKSHGMFGSIDPQTRYKIIAELASVYRNLTGLGG